MERPKFLGPAVELTNPGGFPSGFTPKMPGIFQVITLKMFAYFR